MKKTISVLMAAAMLASSAAAFSTFADSTEGAGGEEATYSDKVLNCGKYIPEIDGEIDEEYYQSYRIVHKFNRDRYWANDSINGKSYNGDYLPEDATEEQKNAMIEDYFQNHAVEATSYFLWDSDNYLYLAIEVKDDTVTKITEEKYKLALDKGTTDIGLWLIDDVMPMFWWPSQNIKFTATVDAGGYCGYVRDNSWIEWNGWSRNEKGEATYNGHGYNQEEGYWAVKLTETGYVVEMALPFKAVCTDILCENKGEGRKEVGYMKYGIMVCDTPEDFRYGRDEGIWNETGEYVEGFQSRDFMILNDLGEFNDPTNVVRFTEAQVTPPAPPVPGYEVGDINGDSKIDTKDLIRLMKYIASKGEGVEAYGADLNEDGVVDTKDLIRLMKLMVSKPETNA